VVAGSGSAAALRRDVEELAGMERLSATAGERRSAEWVAGRLAEVGTSDVELRDFRGRHSFGHVHALHFAAGLAGRAAAALALMGFELDFSGRARPLRRMLPGATGTNVVGRLPARGTRNRTLVLVAHHDAANTGLMWRPELSEGGARREGRPPFSLLPELALLALAAGPSVLRLPARAVLALALGLSLEVARGPVVPGAGDNATGVAALLALVERLAAERPDGLEVVAVAPGCEESGMEGMAAWMAEEGGRLPKPSTLVLSLDTLGAGEPMVASAEGPMWRVAYRGRDLDLADAGARRAGLDPPRRFRLGGWTDPALARLAGLPAISLLSLKGNAFTNYHLPTDTPENVDWVSVERCLELAEATVRVWAE